MLFLFYVAICIYSLTCFFNSETQDFSASSSCGQTTDFYNVAGLWKLEVCIQDKDSGHDNTKKCCSLNQSSSVALE